MSYQLFYTLGGMAIALLGLTYWKSETFARKGLYANNTFQFPSLLPKFMNERTGIALIRYGLGTVLVLVGLMLIAKGYFDWPSSYRPLTR
jgi:hypothetical protein